MIPTVKSFDKNKPIDMDIPITVDRRNIYLSQLIGEMKSQDTRRMVTNSINFGLTQDEMEQAIEAMQNKPEYNQVGLLANDYVRKSEIEGIGMDMAGAAAAAAATEFDAGPPFGALGRQPESVSQQLEEFAYLRDLQAPNTSPASSTATDTTTDAL